MADKKTWTRNADGYFSITMIINGVEKEMKWDPGFTDASCQSGIVIDCANYDTIKAELTNERAQGINRAGHRSTGRSGKGKAKIKGFGPEVETRIITVCGGNTKKLVGACFFRNSAFDDYETSVDHKTDKLTIVNKKQEDEEKAQAERERQAELERLRKELEAEKKKKSGGW